MEANQIMKRLLVLSMLSLATAGCVQSKGALLEGRLVSAQSRLAGAGAVDLRYDQHGRWRRGDREVCRQECERSAMVGSCPGFGRGSASSPRCAESSRRTESCASGRRSLLPAQAWQPRNPSPRGRRLSRQRPRLLSRPPRRSQPPYPLPRPCRSSADRALTHLPHHPPTPGR